MTVCRPSKLSVNARLGAYDMWSPQNCPLTGTNLVSVLCLNKFRLWQIYIRWLHVTTGWLSRRIVGLPLAVIEKRWGYTFKNLALKQHSLIGAMFRFNLYWASHTIDWYVMQMHYPNKQCYQEGSQYFSGNVNTTYISYFRFKLLYVKSLLHRCRILLRRYDDDR